MSESCGLTGSGEDDPTLDAVCDNSPSEGEPPKHLILVADLPEPRAVGAHLDVTFDAPGRGAKTGEESPYRWKVISRPDESGEEEENERSDYPDYEYSFTLGDECLDYETEGGRSEHHGSDEGDNLEEIAGHGEAEDERDVMDKENDREGEEGEIAKCLAEH